MFSTNLKVSLILMIFTLQFVYSQSVVNEHSIKFSNSTSATLVGEDGIIMKTTNNGLDWMEQSSGVTNVLYGNSHKTGLALAVGENGVILKTTDDGENWEFISSGTLENLNDVEVTNSLQAAACGNNGAVLVSNNQGENWSVVSVNTANNLNDIIFVNNNTGFIIGENSTLLKSTDGGNSWTLIEMEFGSRNFNAIYALDEDNIIVVGTQGSIFMTNDGGISWSGVLGLSYETDFNDIVFFNSTNGIIAGNDGLILKTSNGGLSWHPSKVTVSGDDYDFFSVAFADVNNGISTGRNGTEIYTTDGGSTWTESAPEVFSIKTLHSNKSKEVKLNQNYPNPFNPTTNISYELSFDANVNIRVYDMLGKEVASLVSGYQSAGSHTVNFNASNLSSGVYFYTLSVRNGANEIKNVMRMILAK